MFLTRFEPGGTERQMIELIRRLDRERFIVHVACFDTSGAWFAKVKPAARSVAAFPIQGFARLHTLRRLVQFARWCRREGIVVVQTCDLYANVFGLIGAALAGVPVRIGSRRELNPDKTSGQIRLQRLAYRCATRIVANSEAAVAALEADGLRRAAIAVIPNGLDAAAYTPREQRRRLRTAITVANLRVEKGHETLFAAAAAIARSHPDVSFQVVGDGPRRAQLEALVHSQGLANRVEFLGHREDVPALLHAADLYVLPSRSEAFPNGALEAMAAGLPVIASAVGGLRHLIDHGRNGLLVPPADPQALTAAIESLVADPVRAHRLGAAARADVVARYSFDRMVHAFEQLYENQLRGRHVLRPQPAQQGI